MVERLVSFWNGLFSRGMLVLGGVKVHVVSRTIVGEHRRCVCWLVFEAFEVQLQPNRWLAWCVSLWILWSCSSLWVSISTVRFGMHSDQTIGQTRSTKHWPTQVVQEESVDREAIFCHWRERWACCPWGSRILIMITFATMRTMISHTIKW